ncbi:ATP-binding protein [Enterococcus alishanensis]
MVKYKNPIDSIHENLLFTKDGECWAYYSFSPKNIHAGNEDKLNQYKRSFEMLLVRLAKYKDLHLSMLPVEMNLQERFDVLEQDYDPDMLDVGHYYNQRAITVLRDELGTITQSRFYLGVKIKNPIFHTKDSGLKGIATIIRQINRRVMKALGIGMMTSEEKDAFEEKESDVRDLFYGIAINPLEEKELRYICRYNFIRGLPHDYLTESNKTKENISDTLLDTARQPRYIRIEGEYGESYCSFIPIEKTKKDIANMDIFRTAQDFPFPVEVQMKLKVYRKSDVQRKVSMTGKRFSETDGELSERDEQDEELITGKSDLNQLRNELSNKNTPFFNWVACYVVTGDTKDICAERAKEVKLSLEQEYHIIGTQPIADQLDLFYLYLQGADFNTMTENWIQSTLPVAIAELQFGISQRLGTSIGQYIGRITNGIYPDLMSAIQGSRFIVLNHFFLANEGIAGSLTDSPHTLISGQTGKGKSFLMKIIFNYLSFLQGKVLMIDPKTEVKKWYQEVLQDEEIRNNYPMFVKLMENIHYVTLDADKSENQGVLDPLTFLEGSKAKDTILSMLKQVFTISEIRIENEIMRILDDLMLERSDGKKVGLKMLLERLEASEDEDFSEFGEFMRRRVDGSILELAFSNGKTKGLDVSNKVTVLQIEGLQLPDQELAREDMTDQDKMCLSLMIPLAKFCQTFGMADKNEKTTIFFDEAWTITKSHGGNRLVKELLNVGRSYSNQLFLVTPSVGDVNQAISNFGMMYCFDEPQEREKVLEFVGLEDTEYNRELMGAMQKGQCFYKDMYGSVGQLSIDCPFDEWTKAFKTVEQSHSAEMERSFAS